MKCDNTKRMFSSLSPQSSGNLAGEEAESVRAREVGGDQENKVL